MVPTMPLREGWSFTVSDDAIAAVAADYVAGGGDPTDSARFFFGDLAVSSLDALAGGDLSSEQVRVELGNLAVSGYFGGVWLRDNLRGASSTTTPGMTSGTGDLLLSAIGMRIFDALAVGLTGLASTAPPPVVTAAAHISVPVMLALYGYNRGYLEFLLENPPPGVPSMQNTLSCRGFLNCSSSAFPLAIANRYDAALDDLDRPPNLGWLEMSAWAHLMEATTGAGRFVWGLIAQAGGFSADSYAALVDLSSAYLMVGKAGVLSSMTAAAENDADIGRSALLLQAGLWMWSGAYFAGLASGAPRGTMPAIAVA